MASCYRRSESKWLFPIVEPFPLLIYLSKQGKQLKLLSLRSLRRKFQGTHSQVPFSFFTIQLPRYLNRIGTL